MSSEILWRAARHDELALVANSETAAFAPPRGRAWSNDVLAQLFEDTKYRIWLGFAGEIAVGHAIFWSVGEEGEIDRIGVDVEWRGRGVASLAVREILRALAKDGVRSVFLEVREDNLAARRLYQNADFFQVGRRANYYDDGVVALILKCEMEPASTCRE